MAVILFSVLLIAIDQLSKYIVILTLKDNPPKIIIEGVLNFFYLENRGAAFGMLQNKSLLFTIVTVIVIVVLLSILFKDYKRNSLMLNTCIGLILGGSIGNFIDRIVKGYVVDFISFHIFGYDFAIFNLADTFIVVGTFLFLLMILFFDNPREDDHARRISSRSK
ncbi:signal peptidase II [Peptoniphilus equinus]|uniref:Lipoprotein signal peptidase n=1 Tax=Peptoniphilus equinus TaxID=3016343 RepID=A0ABY7QXN6_9FIRM|nr:signal peptidase II [Peptoniphilus equinus]WBW50713.1 signal peptidase II [Peptoniphilus equinus]